MPRHHTGNPREVIDFAVGGLRLVGGILLLWAALGTATLALRLEVVDLSEGIDLETLAAFAGTTVPYLLGGACFLVLAHFLRRRRPWAAVAAIVVTALTFAASALVLCGLAVFMVSEYDTLAMTVPILFGAAFVYALGCLTYHLTKTFDAMRRLDEEKPGGFEPLVAAAAAPQNVLPLPPPDPPPPPIAPDGGSHAPSPQG